ncbi:substrate-binding domain-containing protein [Neorhizobium sp. NCHU2750]|uniref:substrate-binding domain-containing protein n=1 Tax=Neorhizobium sp. NCHU2750 TaxID=1825976 RepID=UPI000E736A89|nr:molybdate ABC transporter substrate-binding protein [Neorhizobium sp. NCHU2750]
MFVQGKLGRIALVVVLMGNTAKADDLNVLISGGFSAAYEPLVAAFEEKTGVHVVTVHGASMGSTPTSIPNRLARGEAADLVILASPALSDLVKAGAIDGSSIVDLAKSRIGLAVKAGAPKPDISTKDGLKSALLAANGVVYSTSASGVYLTTTLFPKLGIAERLKTTGRVSADEPAGVVVARGEADVALQQISELKPVKGIDIVGPIPDSVQLVTVFSVGIPTTAKNRQAAKALIDAMTNAEAAPIINASGMEAIPVPR